MTWKPKQRNGEVRIGDAQVCPVCKGEGTSFGKPCHGCEAKGWVTIWRDQSPTFNIGKVGTENPYGDTESPLFGKGPIPPVLFEGMAPGCHTGRHKHHASVSYIYGDPYDKKCVCCGHPAASMYGEGKQNIPLCDCCWEDWGEVSKSSNIHDWLKSAASGK